MLDIGGCFLSKGIWRGWKQNMPTYNIRRARSLKVFYTGVVFFCEHYMEDNQETHVNPDICNEIHPTIECDHGLSIFNHLTTPFSRAWVRKLTSAKLHHVQTYMLQNREEVEPYISRFDEVVHNQYLELLARRWLDEYRLVKFAKWFMKLVSRVSILTWIQWALQARWMDKQGWELKWTPKGKLKWSFNSLKCTWEKVQGMRIAGTSLGLKRKAHIIFSFTLLLRYAMNIISF